jgi:hypothetical protein
MRERPLDRPLFLLEVDRGIARITRTAEPFDDLSQFRAALAALAPALETAAARLALVDLRGGPPGRNDPEFEAAGVSWRRLLAKRFSKVAILVRTQAGKLQAQRLARAEHRDPHIFFDETQALAYLRADD